MSDWERILRALVDQAFDAKGDHEALTAACEEIISCHTRWPLIEYELAKGRALEHVLPPPIDVDALVQALRESYL